MAYFEYIKTRISKVLLHSNGESIPVHNYASYYFLNEQTELSDDCIYLSDITTALNFIKNTSPSDALLVIGGQSTPGERNKLQKLCADRIPYICSSSQLMSIGNELNDIFRHEAAISSGFITVRQSKNELEDITKMISNICKCTAIIMNMSGYILYSAESHPTDNDWLTDVLSNGSLNTAELRNLCGIANARPYSPAISIQHNDLQLYFGRVLAEGSPHMCMLLVREQKIDDLDVMFLFKRFQGFASAYLMSRHKEGFYESRSAFNAFISDMRNKRLRGGQNIYKRLFSLEFAPPKDMDFLIRLGIIKFSAIRNPNERIPYNLLLTQLRNIFPNTNITAFPNEIFFLFYVPRTEEHITVLRHFEHNRELEDILEQYDGYLTLSRAFDGYSHIETHYHILLRMIELAPYLEKGRVITFHESLDTLITSFFVSYFCESNPPAALADYLHPDVATLWVIDSKENNNLSDVLYYYLLNDRSLQKTAAVTFMHRNTVSYKINQIISLTNIDFNDSEECQIIMASCKLLRYMTKVMRVFPSNGPMRRELQR